MTVDFDQSAQDGGTSDEPATAPVGTADLDKWRQELTTTLTQSFDERFKGFQKILSTRDSEVAELKDMLKELKTADLSDDERVQLEREALEQEKAALAAERELLALQADFPEETDLYRKVLEQPTAKDQISLLREWRTSLTPNQQAEPTPKDDGENASNQSAIDPNNPPVETTDGMDYEAMFEKDPSQLDKILRSGRLQRE